MRHIEPIKKQPKIILRDVLKKKRTFKIFFGPTSVMLAFVHGSLAKNKMKPLSDVDIAILFKNDDYSFNDIAQISNKLETQLHREDIDLAILNKASPLFWMQVLKNGKIIYARSLRAEKEFRLKTIQRYLSTAYLRKYFNQNMEKSILSSPL